MKDPLPSKTTMLPLSITPDTKGLRTLAPWNAFGSRCHLHRVVRCELLPSILTDRLSFLLQGPRIVVISLSPLTVSTQYFWPIVRIHNRFSSTGVNCDFSVSTSPSVATGLLSMDMLPSVTAFRSTSSGHQSPSLELSLRRSSPSLEMSYCGAIIGRRWFTPSFWHTQQTGKFNERQPFTSGTDFGAFRAQGSMCCKASNCSCFPSQQSRNGYSSSRWSSLQGFS